MSNIQVFLSTLETKGNLAYEYNPFHNYQTNVDLYKYETDIGTVIAPDKDKAKVLKNGLVLHPLYGNIWEDKYGNKYNSDIQTVDKGEKYASAGSLIDLDTELLNFDLEHPVDIEVLPSYDGSVNLILNDDKNIPRLINSRFSVREKGTYEIVDRIGENDTNIYSSDTFEKDTSLYFLYKSNPTVQFTNFISGILPVGSYYFCFAYCDADDNESDYIAESGLIPVFLGNDGDPNSMVGGIKNQNSHKGIKLKLQNLDDAYTYLKIYYVRYFADYQLNRVYEAKKIYKKYPINSGTVYLLITGNEQAEDIDANILNISRFNPHHLLTLAQCKNMLFFGNIVKNADNYRELLDCALRIIPKVIEKTFLPTGTDYVYPGYYTSINMYNNVGYFNKEYYRFGVVFIYENGTLSNVYNTLGYDIVNGEKNNITYNNNNNKGCMYEESDNLAILVRKYIKSDDEGWIKNFSDFFTLGEDIPSNTINSKGVIKLNKEYTSNKILGILFNIPNEVIKFLKETLHIRGLFFVRQKCIPSTIALCYLLPMDEVLKAPVLKVGDLYQTESFITRKKTLTNDYNQRLYAYNGETSTENKISKHAYAAICPDFLLDLPYYNQIFNGSSFKLNQITNSNDFHRSDRFYTDGNTLSENASNTINPTVSICSVTEDVPTVAIKDSIYKLLIGEAEEAFRFGFVEYDNSSMDNENNGTDKKENYYFNIIRGKYSPYLAIYSDVELTVNSLYDIMYDQQNPIQEFKNRMDSFEPFYAISNRYNFEQLEGDSDKSITCFRGDCYLNTFTYRLNRNFNDPTLPSNDEIIDPNTWKDHYKLDDPTEWTKISRSDVNAIQMGSWITFQVRSAMNYALRSEDASNVAEAALMGQPRSFYPKNKLLFRGNNKIPDSYVFNDAYRATLGFKCYFTLNDINYIKDTFSNRIQYSAISVQDSYKNNYRYSLSTYFRDYSQEYGSITKLVGFEGYLLVIFEHGIGIAVINERILAGQGDGEPVFINTKNVLPEELTIISDTIGTQWGESVVKSEAGYVYGVDTIAKKIWRVKSQQLEIISDFKVNKFLVDNITLGERENHPYIALKNVKTHYNNNKKDIMFTFYDDVYKEEEKVWNLCYNEYLDEFVTFYSWVPSYSENIDTSFFSFNRETSKALSLLEKSNYYNLNNYGVLLEYPVIDDTDEEITYPKLHYRVKHRTYYTIKEGLDGTVENAEHNVGLGDFEKETEFSDFVIEFSQYGWNKYFEVVKNHDNEYKIRLKLGTTLEDIKNMMKENNSKVIILNITPQISKIENQVNALNDITKFRTETVAFTFKSIVQNIVNLDELNLTTDFFVHGQGGIYDLKENIYPTRWYGETHPFEFEFVVNEQIAYQKVFTNLIIISNKAEPESFHFEIEGDNYEFSSDKRTMYFRQESTKKLFLKAGSDILYDRKYEDVAANLLTKELYYRKLDDDYQNQYVDFKNYHGVDRTYPIESGGLTQQVKSTIFPLYYKRIDKYNYIYDKYQELVSDGKNYLNLSGSEIIWNRDLNQFNIATHIKNSPIDHYGRLRGNSFYKEGKWNIQIPSLNFMLKNEKPWTEGTPPIIVLYLPEGVSVINESHIADTYETLDIKNPSEYAIAENWTYRKEAKIRDKWIKIRVRYSGYNLAVIHSLVTLFNLSYS